MRQLFAKGCLSETNKLLTFDEFSQKQTCLKLMSEFVKDQRKEKASVVILTLSFEPEGIKEEMGHLHNGILWTCWIAWTVHSTAVKFKEKFTSISSIMHEQVMEGRKRGKVSTLPGHIHWGKKCDFVQQE